jgi:hypothetical protein
MALASAAAENAALNGIAGVGNTNTVPDMSLHSATLTQGPTPGKQSRGTRLLAVR